MDRGYIEKHGIERIVFTDGTVVVDPLYIKLDAVRRGLFRRFDHMIEVLWIIDGVIHARRCRKCDVSVYLIQPTVECNESEGVNA